MRTLFHRKPIRILLCIAAFLLAVVLLLAVMDPYDCKIAEDVSVCGVDVGGMSLWEARNAVNTAAEHTILSQPLTVNLPQETLTLPPEEANIKINTFKILWTVFRAGRGGNEEDVQALRRSILPYLSVNKSYIEGLLQDYAHRYDSSFSESHYGLDGTIAELKADVFDADAACPLLVLTTGTPEVHLDIPLAYSRILTGYDQAFQTVETNVTIEILPESIPQELNLDAIYEELCILPVNDSLDLKTYEHISGSYGCVFDLEEAKKAVGNAGWGETVTIPMTYQPPEILGDDVYFRDVLGHCETKHTDDENRNTNLRLVCQILDGLVLQPGEEFSYNGVIGERTEERGFRPAGAYSGNRLVKDIGGGVCQGSSTLYNCVLLADLEVTERVCHGFTVNYLPIGLDAAVNWATKTDFKFRNNFHFPIMLKAEVSDGYMKMQILGTDEKDYYIEMKSGYSEEELRIYSNSYKYKYDKETGELISKDLEARSSYMYYTG